MNEAGDAGAWYLLCTLSLASCRLRAESLARHLHGKFWTAGRFETPGVMESRPEVDDDAGDSSNVLIVDRAPQPSTLKFYHNQHHFANGHLWQNNLYVSEDDDEIYEPTSSDSQVVGMSPSPPIPVDEDDEIIVNSSTGPGLIMPPHHAMNRLGLTSDHTTTIGNNEALYEKLMQFAETNSLSDGDTSDTYYDVDSSSNSSNEDHGVKDEDLDVVTGITQKLLTSDSSFDSGLNECFDSGVNGVIEEPDDGTPLACSSPVTPPPSPPLTLPNGSCVTDIFEAEPESSLPTEIEVIYVKEESQPSSTKCKFHVTPIDDEVQTQCSSETDSSEEVTQKKEPVDELEKKDTNVTSRTDWFFLDHPALRETLQSTLVIGDKKENVDEEEDEDEMSGEMQRTRLLRSTSLKTGKTPPGTPRRKKIVRFADALGLDLEAVRHIVSDDLPNIPASAFTDLHIVDTTSFQRAAIPVGSTAPSGISGKVLYPQFPQPVSDPCFMDRLRRQKVCLENVVVADLSLQCLIRVLNVGYEKSVVVRYSINEWTSHQEVQCSYVQASSDGYTDKFCVHLYASQLTPGQRLIFAIHYVVNGQEYWDNNFGQNYVLRCHSTTPSTLVGGADDTSSPWYYHFM